MDISHILDSLNEPQREAVTAPLGNALVLAGAGSGKTRVLVQRIAWLIQVEKMSPFSILSVTFTNKAAHEMRHRIEAILEMPSRGMWVGTFHGLAHRLLRAHWRDADLPESFQILDSEDQHRMVKRVLKAMDLSDDQWAPRTIQWFINGKKDEGLRPENIPDHGDMHMKTMIRIYDAYEQACQRAGAVDFAELLLRAHELWLKHPEILAHYQNRFQHVLVDEFQDTNSIQYAWLRMLARDHASVTIVGDDDQSIYGWRGAKIENIHRFTSDFKDVKTIRLEQNYRSTSTILNAANAVIANNTSRLGKDLWTQGNAGEPIAVYSAFNDLDEARYIADRILMWSDGGGCRREVAILYRSNAQSRVIEEALLQARIPYRVYGGLRFFDRAEIKDVLAYLRMINHRGDDAAFERVVNTPTRGIGERTVAEVRALAKDNNMSLWDASLQILDNKLLTARASNALQGFCDLITELDNATSDLPLDEKADHVTHRSGLWEHYNKAKSEKTQSRLENLRELVTAAKEFRPDPDDELPLLASFLSHAALEAGEMQSGDEQDCVQLMTLHTAKGLEFPLVFISGVEEGLFPHRMSLEEPGRLEEERRLFYVGITRAMQKLHLTHAELRRQHGKEEYHRPSSFLKEIPSEHLEEVRSRNVRAGMNTASTPSKTQRSPFGENFDAGDTGFRLGQRVVHAKFGDGVVLNYEGRGAHARIQVQFDEGVKWLVLSYANLSPA